jgi:hypothetical protein
MARNHYLVLGISRSETEGGIQAAFRVMAKRFHPDVAGIEEASHFREIVEAYEVLSNPERRRRYDEALEPETPAVSETRTPMRPSLRRDRPEPLVPDTLSIANDFDLLRPSRADLLGRVRRNFLGTAPKAERIEPLNVVVLVPAEKALVGGTITLGVPVFFPCPYCRGTGRDWISDCLQCGGEGEVSVDRPVQVRVPPFAGRRAVLDVPLSGVGIRNLYLRLQLQVG